jgi:hypothetical protein
MTLLAEREEGGEKDAVDPRPLARRLMHVALPWSL